MRGARDGAFLLAENTNNQPSLSMQVPFSHHVSSCRCERNSPTAMYDDDRRNWIHAAGTTSTMKL